MSEGDDRLCPAMWLMDHFEDVASSRGEISIGGMITLLALYHNLNLEGLETVPGETLIDIRSMKSMHWISDVEGTNMFIWQVSGRNYAYLPDPERTVIYMPQNWLFYPDFPWEADDGGDDRADDDDGDDEGDGGGQERGRGRGIDVPGTSGQAGPSGGHGELEQQVAALQGDVRDLRADFGSMSLEVGSIRTSIDHMTSEFQGLRNDLRSWARFQGWNPPE